MNFNFKADIRHSVFSILIVLFIISFPLGYRINTMLLYVFLIFFFTDSKSSIKNKWLKIKSNRVIKAYIMFFLVQFIGLVYSNDFNEASKKILLLLPVIFLPAIILCELKVFYKQKLFQIIKILIPVNFILIALYYRLFLNYEGMDRFVQITYIDTIGISQFYLIFILLMPLLIILNDIKKENLYLDISLIVVLSYFVIIMNNFTGVAFLIFILFLTLKKILRNNNNNKKLFISIVGFGVVLSLFTIIIANNKFERKFQPLKYTTLNIENIKTKNKYAYTRNTLEHRIYIYNLVLTDLKNTFPFGVGTGDTQSYLNNLYLENNFLTGIKLKLNAHSQYLQEYLKTGLIGLFTLIFLVYTLLRYVIKVNQYYSYFIIFFCIGCLVESYLNRYHGVIILSALIPILIFNEDDQNR
ncbi:O-antigen polymerase [Galbibacter marinus]|uniref:O-antigen polymerase n=1 Tax=Galbibacter marinus TaxID=555500 RepID=K2PPH3_9FLAO|nr:O-antigen ligase family protein [Galbibacter marinus]EKF54430.1 O-antigen polymerase [Galbibacter marinus]